MSFGTYESSRYRGEPVDLYFFRYGTAPNAYFAYTDAEEDISFAGITYVPTPLAREKFTASGSLDKTLLKILMPIDTGVSNLFRVYPPGQVVTLIIRQGHVNDPDNDFKVIWTGRVVQCQRSGSEAEIACEPVSTSLKRSGLRRHYQLSCPHVLYGHQCQASQGAATVARQVISLTGTKVTLQDGWSGAVNPQKYLGGMIEWMGVSGLERRTILRVTDLKTLSLSGSTTGITAGQMINVVLGCNHQMSDCLALHNNIHNFGGQPWIPTANPINTNPFS